MTTTVKGHVLTKLLLSVAMQLPYVVPIEYVAPEVKLHVSVLIPEPSMAVGANVATAPLVLVGGMLKEVGQVMDGLVVSVTYTR